MFHTSYLPKGRRFNWYSDLSPVS